MTLVAQGLMRAGLVLRRLGDRLFCSRFFVFLLGHVRFYISGVLPSNGPWPVPFTTFASHFSYLGLLPYQNLIRCS